MTALTISTGRLRGRAVGSSITAYLGIPYAAPPVGPLRFAPPQPPAAWYGVRVATRFGSAAPQAVAAFGPVRDGQLVPVDLTATARPVVSAF